MGAVESGSGSGGMEPPCTISGIDFADAAPVVLATVPSPAGLAVDGANLYVASYEIGPVFEVPLDGGAVITLDAIGANNVAINSKAVYTVEGGGGPGPQGVVVGCAKTGCGGNYATLASGQTDVWGVAADDTNVYWTDQGPGVVAKVSVNGGTPTTLAAVIANEIAVSAGRLFFAGETSPGPEGLWTVPVDGGAATILYTPDGADAGNGIAGLAADTNYVYFATTQSGIIARIPVGGGNAVTLASGQRFAASLAVDATNVYWSGDANGALVTVPICGGNVTTLATRGGSGIAVDANNVYWTNTNDGTVMKRAKIATP
jgi:hypothetical protein